MEGFRDIKGRRRAGVIYNKQTEMLMADREGGKWKKLRGNGEEFTVTLDYRPGNCSDCCHFLRAAQEKQ